MASIHQATVVTIVALSSLSCATQPVTSSTDGAKRAMADVLAASSASDWRAVDPANTLYLDLANGGRVVIELAPQFAPNHVRNILQLANQGFYDGLTITRVQDNFVVQWADADNSRSVGDAHKTLLAEFTRTLDRLAFTALADRDGFAPEAGLSMVFRRHAMPRLAPLGLLTATERSVSVATTPLTVAVARNSMWS